MTDNPASLVEHAKSDIAYVEGLQAHLDEGGMVGVKNVTDLIAMVRWNAEHHIEAAAALTALSSAPASDVREALAILDKHGVLTDELAAHLPEDARNAWYHLTSMYSHRGDGILTQFTYPQAVHDAAKALVRAALERTAQ